MYDQIIHLITEKITTNDYGDPVGTELSRRSVFCRAVSANFREKTLAESRGLTADRTFILPDGMDYNGEKIVDYNGTRYRVTDTSDGDTSNELRLVVSLWRTA